MSNYDGVNGHDPLQPGEVEASVSGVEDPVAEALDLFGFEIEVGLELTVSAEVADAAPAAMRLRGALVSVLPMMEGGLQDLLHGADLDEVMASALGTWGVGGRMVIDSSLEAVDDWLVDHGLPTVSLYPVTSSNLEAMGWADPNDEDEPSVAVVLFKNGTMYAYDGVPEKVFHEWWSADSQGAYLNTEIKGAFPYRQLI